MVFTFNLKNLAVIATDQTSLVLAGRDAIATTTSHSAARTLLIRMIMANPRASPYSSKQIARRTSCCLPVRIRDMRKPTRVRLIP